MDKVSYEPGICGILWPDQTATYTVTHNVDTGEVAIDTGGGVFQATLDENNCGQASECLTAPDIFCSDGCTYNFAGCFSEGNPPTVAGTAPIEVHDPDGELCGGDISCTIYYDVTGERISQNASQRAGPSVWQSVGTFFARLGRALGLRREPE
jgi:hypothetical protein